MKLRVVSDLHTEFDGGAESPILADLAYRRGDDALVVAGDLATAEHLAAAIDVLCRMWPTVIFVPGNHEYYGSSFDEVDSLLDALHQRYYPTLRVLRAGTLAVLGGRRVLGCTLWFPETPNTVLLSTALADFQQIRGFAPAVYDRCRQDSEFLRQNVRRGDIVITHHLPSVRSIATKFAGSALNHFFVAPMDDLIEGAQPAAWIHGHTHARMKYRIGATQVACNPRGYAGHELEVVGQFDPTFSVTV